MALFKLRKARDEQPAPAAAAPAQSVEAMRRRALHRLIGAAVLVLAGVIGFPLVFDNQPRPIPVDLPIEIADKGNVKPLVVPAAAPAAKPDTTPAAPAPPAATVPAKPASPVVAPVPAAAPAVATAEPIPAKPAAAADPATGKSGEATKAQSLLDGKEPAAKAAAGEGRFVVQVGAFSDADKLREVRRKVEGAGFKTYTQVVDTKEGSRTRVRVGPFPDKEQASKVAEKIRKLDLPASILSL